ncbi:MAG: methylenetetrahydrofolate--tRNA-(uracil(54)-C(5))-methyltransferase (FADH(2)-oxidizing) TrmFO, partial [Porcipelethomonas sp.]
MVSIIGGGLAGCEAAWQLAGAGIECAIYEMKPHKYTPAHHYKGLAELVCSNSLKAARHDSAAGLLKEEMEMLGSLIVPCARENAVEAGGALAVDREKFSDAVTKKIMDNPLIHVIDEEVTEIPDGDVIIATGPLTSGGLAESIRKKCGDYLSFFDAAAPIVTFESLDMDKVFFASRYDRGDADYINCPMNREEYLEFYNALITAESAPLKEFDKRDFKVYEGCMPVEVLAKRGEDTMRFGPLKPVGLIDKRTGKRPYAVVQLRKENAEGTMYNLVGFQTHLKFGEQKRVFSMITGLENAEFVRYGVMHRNSFIDSPKLLSPDYSLKENPDIFFAGQITGVEGYIESAASGIM